MVGIFTFLLLASVIAFAVAIILLILRAVKKKPKKPVVIVLAASMLVFVASSVGGGMTYHPTPEQIAERERIAAEKAAEKEEREREKAEEAAKKEAEEAAKKEAEEAAKKEAEEAAKKEAEEAAKKKSSEPPQTPETSPVETTPEPVSKSSEPPKKLETEPVESVPDVTQADKDAAIALDAEIFAICIKAEQDYKDFLTLVSADGTSNLDAYNAAKTLKENLTEYNYHQLSEIKGADLDEFDEYKQNASVYIYVMSETAKAAMKFLDDPKTSNLSAFQEAVETVSTYSLSLVASRMTFLSASGLSDDEIYSAMGVTPSE